MVFFKAKISQTCTIYNFFSFFKRQRLLNIVFMTLFILIFLKYFLDFLLLKALSLHLVVFLVEVVCSLLLHFDSCVFVLLVANSKHELFYVFY